VWDTDGGDNQQTTAQRDKNAHAMKKPIRTESKRKDKGKTVLKRVSGYAPETKTSTKNLEETRTSTEPDVYRENWGQKKKIGEGTAV